MINTMEYKGYAGSVEFSEEDSILFGKVQGIRSLISCEGTTVSELIADFHGAADDYLSFCISKTKNRKSPLKAASMSASGIRCCISVLLYMHSGIIHL